MVAITPEPKYRLDREIDYFDLLQTWLPEEDLALEHPDSVQVLAGSIRRAYTEANRIRQGEHALLQIKSVVEIREPLLDFLLANEDAFAQMLEIGVAEVFYDLVSLCCKDPSSTPAVFNSFFNWICAQEHYCGEQTYRRLEAVADKLHFPWFKLIES